MGPKHYLEWLEEQENLLYKPLQIVLEEEQPKTAQALANAISAQYQDLLWNSYFSWERYVIQLAQVECLSQFHPGHQPHIWVQNQDRTTQSLIVWPVRFQEVGQNIGLLASTANLADRSIFDKAIASLITYNDEVRQLHALTDVLVIFLANGDIHQGVLIDREEAPASINFGQLPDQEPYYLDNINILPLEHNEFADQVKKLATYSYNGHPFSEIFEEQSKKGYQVRHPAYKMKEKSPTKAHAIRQALQVLAYEAKNSDSIQPKEPVSVIDLATGKPVWSSQKLSLPQT